jgi:hypothetical protein
MALQPFVGPCPLFRFLNLYTVGRTPRTGDHPAARPLRAHRKTQIQNKSKQYRHPWFEWDSNPRSQRSSYRRQFKPSTARQLWSANIIVYVLEIPYKGTALPLPATLRKVMLMLWPSLCPLPLRQFGPLSECMMLVTRLPYLYSCTNNI